MAVPTPLDWLHRLRAELIGRQNEMSRMEAYYLGEHPLPFLTRAHESKIRSEYRVLLEDSRSNFMRLVVDAVEERLRVDGFRLSAQNDQRADDATWEIWQANQMDAESQTAFLEALVKGVAYLSVWAGEPHPTIAVEDPMQTIVGYEDGSGFRRRAAALKIWTDEWTARERANVYLPNGIYKFERQQATKSSPAASVTTDETRFGGATSPTSRAASALDDGHVWVELEELFVPNPVGVVPIVPLRNRPRLTVEGESEISDVCRVQNQINGFLFLLAIAGYFGAHRQRWMVGGEISEADSSGQKKEPFNVAIDRLWQTDDPNAKFGEFGQTDLTQYIKAIEQKVLHIAVTTRTPRHYLIEQGQALALDTPVPTPGGMRTIGDLEAGDLVYDENGAAQIVSVAHPVLEGRPCYRVTFSDGSDVIADENHLWFTQTVYERWKDKASNYKRGVGKAAMRSHSPCAGAVRTTKQIAESLLYRRVDGSLILRGRNGTPRYNHSVTVAAALQAPHADLPIDPYALGVWLGDGSAAHAVVTQHVDDVPFLERELVAVGETVTVRKDRWETTRRLALGRRPDGSRFRTSLRQLGVLGNKHIPECYFQASPAQRLALLQGLMDTDGTAGRSASGVALDLHDERLARDCHRLVQSLGWKASLRTQMYTKEAGIESARGTWTRWRMCWTPDTIVFRMPRKARKQRLPKHPDSNVKRRQIVSVEPVPSVPVRCITVTGESSLFLVGEACIPTHNSPSGDAIKSAESGLTKKVERKHGPFGEGLEETLRLARMFAGETTQPVDSQVQWADPSISTEAEITDAAVKKWQIGLISWQQAAEDCGYSQTQIARMLDTFGGSPPVPRTRANDQPETRSDVDEIEAATA